MGGALFTTGSDPLQVPRLPTPLYITLKSQYTSILLEHFDRVISPFEAPEKDSHGDLDFLVSGSKSSTSKTTTETLSDVFSSRRAHVNGATTSFAVQHPEYKEGEAYVQVDVHVCQPDRIVWEAFEHSYGDLWQIIGVCIRPLGFTATDKGFFVRIAEMEDAGDRKGSFIFLSEEPAEVLNFLGLDEAKYNAGFSTERELFAWVTEGAFFSLDLVRQMRSKSNDRRRMRLRPMFHRFVDEWIKELDEAGVEGNTTLWTRKSALNLALARYSATSVYDAKLAAHNTTQRVRAFWVDAAKVVPTNDRDKVNLVLRALKRWVDFPIDTNETAIFRDEADVDDSAADKWIRAIERLGEEKLLEWVEHNWEDLQVREKSRMKKLKQERAAEKERIREGKM